MTSQSWPKQTFCHNENQGDLALFFGFQAVIEGGTVQSFCGIQEGVRREIQKSAKYI